ncbi:hypothetical protein HOY80DRAFT_1038816 [Tuber brumale]|nr:hypothetical protein HOY80DRAFT_1038816 [Tuber brumale]
MSTHVVSGREIKKLPLLSHLPVANYLSYTSNSSALSFPKHNRLVKMATPSLATAWSLDTTFPGGNVRPSILSSTSPLELAHWAVTTYAASRWGVHFVANLINRIPSSESRLRSEGFMAFYKSVCDVNARVSEIAQQKGISLPPLPALLGDSGQEDSDVGREVLGAAVSSHVALPIKPLMDTIGTLMRTGDSYHWGSLAAFVGVAADAYVNAVNATKISQSTPGEHAAAPFVQAITSENMLEACKVMREELVQCRAEASQKGWKDEEARNLAQEFLKYFKNFPSVGL